MTLLLVQGNTQYARSMLRISTMTIVPNALCILQVLVHGDCIGNARFPCYRLVHDDYLPNARFACYRSYYTMIVPVAQLQVMGLVQ